MFTISIQWIRFNDQWKSLNVSISLRFRFEGARAHILSHIWNQIANYIFLSEIQLLRIVKEMKFFIGINKLQISNANDFDTCGHPND